LISVVLLETPLEVAVAAATVVAMAEVVVVMVLLEVALVPAVVPLLLVALLPAMVTMLRRSVFYVTSPEEDNDVDEVVGHGNQVRHCSWLIIVCVLIGNCFCSTNNSASQMFSN
jgi:fatty acid desaturase